HRHSSRSVNTTTRIESLRLCSKITFPFSEKLAKKGRKSYFVWQSGKVIFEQSLRLSALSSQQLEGAVAMRAVGRIVPFLLIVDNLKRALEIELGQSEHPLDPYLTL